MKQILTFVMSFLFVFQLVIYSTSRNQQNWKIKHFDDNIPWSFAILSDIHIGDAGGQIVCFNGQTSNFVETLIFNFSISIQTGH
jgi:hypothetical protein